MHVSGALGEGAITYESHLCVSLQGYIGLSSFDDGAFYSFVKQEYLQPRISTDCICVVHFKTYVIPGVCYLY